MNKRTKEITNTIRNLANIYNFPALKITMIQLILGVLWIIFSDEITVIKAGNHQSIQTIQTHKGLVYIFITSILLYILIYFNNYKIKEAQQELQNENKKLQLAVNANGSWMWEWDLTNNVILKSINGYKMLGYEEQEESRLDVSDYMKLVHPQDIDMINDSIISYLNKEIPKYEVEFRMKTKKGKYIWVMSTGQATWNKNGKATNMFGINTDISEHKRKEKMLSDELTTTMLRCHKKLCMITPRFINTNAFDKAIMDTLDDINSLNKAEYIGLHILKRDYESIKKGYHKIEVISSDQKDKIDIMTRDLASLLINKIEENEENILYIEDTKNPKIEDEKKIAELLSSYVESALVIPVRINKEIIGLLALYNDTSRRRKDDILLVKSIVQIIENALEKKITEEQLRERREVFNKIYNNDMVPMTIIDPDTKIIVNANPAAGRLHGYLDNGLVGKKVTEVTTLSEDEAKEAIENIINNSGHTLRLRDKTVDGKTIILDVHGVPFNDKGKTYICTLTYDISDKVEAQERLDEKELKYQELFNHINDYVFLNILNQDHSIGNFIEVNDIAYKELGYTKEEILKLNPIDINSEETRDKAITFIEQIREHGNYTTEALYITKDGKKIPVEINGHTFKLNGQDVVLAVARDISERKKMEEELKKSNRGMQRIIQELHETQAQLIQQEKLAGIGQLAAGVAHEINNPIGFIMSNFNTLKKYFIRYKETLEIYKDLKDSLHYLSNEELKKKINNISQIEDRNNLDFINQDLMELFSDTDNGLERVLEIVKSLRNFSRVDSYSEYEPYDINEGIKSTLVVARNETRYCAAVEYNLEKVPSINALGGQINQVLLNLILNAVHAIKIRESNGFGTIRISTYNDDHYVYCSIADNGIGIKKEQITAIFNPFYTTKPVGEGTGLGLSIAYDIIVNKHKGDISVKSEEGVGTEFIIKLPLIVEH